MSEPVPVVPEAIASQTLGFWDAQIRTVSGLGKEIGLEYVSKDRLRKIAMVLCVQLLALMEAAKASEQLEQTGSSGEDSAESQILTMDQRIILP
jgi:ribulose bisphosphate carboxylase small subunit